MKKKFKNAINIENIIKKKAGMKIGKTKKHTKKCKKTPHLIHISHLPLIFII